MNGHERALQALMTRVDIIEQQVGDRFPLYRDPHTDVWITTRRGSWAGGFWVGLLWLRAVVSHEAGHHDIAVTWTQRLLPRAADDTVTRGMTFGYGAAVPHRLTGDATAATVAAVGADALAGSFDPRWGLIPVGTAFDNDARPRAAVDALGGVVTLLSWAGELQPADRHTARLAALCVEPDGAVHAEVPLTGAVPEAKPWARGQAWAMLGFSVAAQRLGSQTHLCTAASTADLWMIQQADPSDSSSAAIAAAALLTLPGEHYHNAGLSIVDGLAGRIDGNGVLAGGHYGELDDAETIWGTYFAAAVMAEVTGCVETAPW